MMPKSRESKNKVACHRGKAWDGVRVVGGILGTLVGNLPGGEMGVRSLYD